MRNIVRLVVVMMAVTFLASLAHAEDKSVKKLKRGAVNIVTAPIEIPKNFRAYWIEGSKHTPHILVWLFSGTVKGVADMTKRAGSGVWDIMTSEMDNGKVDESLVKPDYVLQGWPTRNDSTVTPLVSKK